MKVFGLFLAFTSLNLFAAEPTIVGAWHMDEWLVTTKEGVVSEFCQGGQGVLLYAPSGHVSTSINCPTSRPGLKEPADEYQRQFFYAGTYTVSQGVISKPITNATYEPLIGKTVLRYIEKLTDKELVLTGTFGPRAEKLWIRWVR